MVNTVDRLEFAAALHEEMLSRDSNELFTPGASPYRTATLAKRLMAAGRRLHRLAEDKCNGHATDAGADACDAAIDRAKKRVRALLAPYGIGARFEGDPRGCALQLILPRTKRTNGWAAEGYCVPR